MQTKGKTKINKEDLEKGFKLYLENDEVKNRGEDEQLTKYVLQCICNLLHCSFQICNIFVFILQMSGKVISLSPELLKPGTGKKKQENNTKEKENLSTRSSTKYIKKSIIKKIKTPKTAKR